MANIEQDFQVQDPDRIVKVFREDLEKQAETTKRLRQRPPKTEEKIKREEIEALRRREPVVLGSFCLTDAGASILVFSKEMHWRQHFGISIDWRNGEDRSKGKRFLFAVCEALDIGQDLERLDGLGAPNPNGTHTEVFALRCWGDQNDYIEGLEYNGNRFTLEDWYTREGLKPTSPYDRRCQNLRNAIQYSEETIAKRKEQLATLQLPKPEWLDPFVPGASVHVVGVGVDMAMDSDSMVVVKLRVDPPAKYVEIDPKDLDGDGRWEKTK